MTHRLATALSALLELFGVALVLFAAYAVDWRLAAALGGVVAVFVGWVLDRPQAAPRADE